LRREPPARHSERQSDRDLVTATDRTHEEECGDVERGHQQNGERHGEEPIRERHTPVPDWAERLRSACLEQRLRHNLRRGNQASLRMGILCAEAAQHAVPVLVRPEANEKRQESRVSIRRPTRPALRAGSPRAERNPKINRFQIDSLKR
jgi:hypothetical protein